MGRQINYMPLRDALIAAGIEEVKGRVLYQDYLNIVVGQGMSRETVPPMSEEQWEVMCDMLGSDRPMYASNVKAALQNLKRKAEEKA